jgi:hypothetical protein
MENDDSLKPTKEFATFPYSELHASSLPNSVCNVRCIFILSSYLRVGLF